MQFYLFFHILLLLILFVNPTNGNLHAKEKQENVEQHACPICYDALDMIELNANETMKLNNETSISTNTAFLPCNHQLCFQCWVECISEEMSACPLCRDPRLQLYLIRPYSEVIMQNIIEHKSYSSEKLSRFFFLFHCVWKIFTCPIFISKI